jgi:hypothetical protein
MATRNKKISDVDALSADLPAGAFPFPLSDTQEESRYLTWLRNHSNYMAVRGFLDYFRSISVLLRGIVLNFLIFLPALLFVAIGLAYSHHWMLANPFLLTRWTVALAAAAILLFPIGAQLFKIFSYGKSLETGSESSVKLRNMFEQLFGRLLMLILAVAIVESLPWVLEFVHEKLQKEKLSLQGGLTAVVAIFTFLSGANNLLSGLSGARKTLAMGLIGILGTLLPVLVILYATDYLLYGFPPSPYVLLSPLAAIALFVLAIFIAIGIGVLRGFFGGQEIVVSIVLFILAILALSGGTVYLAGKAQREGDIAKDALTALLTPVTKLARGVEGITKVNDVDAGLVALFDDFQLANNELMTFNEELNDRTDPDDALKPPAFSCEAFPECLNSFSRKLRDHLPWSNFRLYWGNEQQRWKDYKEGVSLVMPMASILVDLKTMPESQLQVPRSKLAALARRYLSEYQGRLASEKIITDDNLARAISPATYYKTAIEHRNEISRHKLTEFTADQLEFIANNKSDLADDLIAKMMFGEFAGLERDESASLDFKRRLTGTSIDTTALFIALLAVLVWLGCWLTVDVNLTSIHGLYRDRLASAFLIGKDTKGDVDIEDDLDLHHICRYEENSVAPYHLINVALNLQASKELRIRDRQSDFFIFSKRFIGGQRTGYCRSETMEQVFPQMSLATAMAISAAAASPNMGRGTSPLLVAFMTLLNVRLGYWLPNPGLLEESAVKSRWEMWKMRTRQAEQPPGFTFREVFAQEMHDIESRWRKVYDAGERQRRLSDSTPEPTTRHGLVGIAFSGGGIRSAAINLGITQALHSGGVFAHVDYMSTVSGGGYLGSSISALMRSGATPDGEALPMPKTTWGQSEIAGKVAVETASTAQREQVVRVESSKDNTDEDREYHFTRFDSVIVKNGEHVNAGQELTKRRNAIGDRFRWRVRPVAFLREMISKLDETHRWVNLSDGGHIENMAAMELLRRRCKYIIIGDGEADPDLHFAGLATLMRSAYLDLGIKIDINLDAIRLRKDDVSGENAKVSNEHWAIGTILYPTTIDNKEPEEGYLLYLKSSYTGDENEIIREYRHRNPAFPHQTTADQFFDEGQFEAYRALGEHIAELALKGKHTVENTEENLRSRSSVTKLSYLQLENWFADLWKNRKPSQKSVQA